jgi:phage shock protein C
MKKIYKSKESVVASGIFGGLGEWLEVSPGILRIGYIVLIVITGIIPGILLYIAVHFLMSKEK